jgi:N-acetylglucosaminyl-diphospho-decaprenol L-rhamnosyltransferase
MQESGSLDVVIVSYRCRNLLQGCLATLRAHALSRPLRVTVVDNDSRDGTVEMVAKEFTEVRLLAADRNLGFSAANNLAIRGGESTYVLALNPDTRLTEGALDRLVELMDSRPEIGICGCRLEREDGSLDHAARRSFPTVLGALGHFTGVGRRRSTGSLAQYRAPDVDSGPVDAVNGAFMLMRRTTLDEIGLFDEGFWLYMEDLDLCYRCWEVGQVVWYEPDVTVVHVKHGTTGKYRTPRVNYAFHYGMYRFYRKHYAPHRSALVNGAVYLGIAGKLGLSLLRSEVGRRMIPRPAS